MKKNKKTILELKKESIVALSKRQYMNIVGGDIEAGLTTLNVCQHGTNIHTSAKISG